MPSGSGTSLLRARPTWRTRGPRGPSGAASTAGTASMAVRPTNSSLPCTTTTTLCARPPHSTRATTSARISPTGPSNIWATCAPSTTSCPSSCTSPRAPATRPTMRRRSGSSTTRAASPRAGTPGARRPSPASSPRASCPRARSSRRAHRGSQPGRRSTSASANWLSASWSALPPSCPTPTSRSAGCSPSSRSWVTRTTPW